MADPRIQPASLTRVTPAVPGRSTSVDPPAGSPGDFAAELRQQLEQVSRIQSQADQGVRDLLTGRSDNVTEVFSAARKAQVAFSLLMEIRNKLADAYVELRQLRV